VANIGHKVDKKRLNHKQHDTDDRWSINVVTEVIESEPTKEKQEKDEISLESAPPKHKGSTRRHNH